MQFFRLLSRPGPAILRCMTESPPNRAIAAPADILPPEASPAAGAAAALAPTASGQAALAAAQGDAWAQNALGTM